MTLRTWGLLAILGIFAIIMTAHADSLWDEMGPSVSEQMATQAVIAKVVAFEARGSALVYKITANGDSSTLRLCPGLASEGVNGVLQEAYRSGDSVKLGLTGPFNSCVVTARVSKGA